jgi:two-component system response regulator
MPKAILLVEDTADDVFFLTRAFKRAGFQGPIHHAEDGRRAIEYLSGQGDLAGRNRAPLPCVVLLDIKMPFVSGFEVLRWIRQESGCPRLPVVMFTSSDQENDVEQAYALGANAYLVKPSHSDQFVRLAELIKGFWTEANVPASRAETVQDCAPEAAAG